ncbi:MAG: lysine--tRNA ligase [Deltaproteobacteria bacterium]|nr:lysine--tRNA ligase [Deltaproteobacteria bacterium]
MNAQKPFSPHWADIAAFQVVQNKGDKDTYTAASGITPSGTVHVGNFREVITVDLVVRALRSLGKNVRFIYSWDNFDTFRKVPKNLPDPEAFQPHLRKPIARIPDPWGLEATYAKGRMALFEKELAQVGISPEYISQEQRYSSGTYAKDIRFALEKKDQIREILDRFRTQALSEDWLPTAIYCSKCQKDEMEYERYNGEWTYSYKCKSCGLEERVDIRKTLNLKLAWRIDWPMRWAFEGVDFEPGGKDHSSEGGSFDSGKQIVKEVWGKDPPQYLQYDFVMIKGGAGKMSSSSGELYTLSQVLEVYEPQIVRWIFANHRPNHDFALAFDEDVFKVYDEFDKAESMALAPAPHRPGKWPLLRRTYELSLPDGKLPSEMPQRPKFRELCSRLQICGGDTERTWEKFYKNEMGESKKPYFMLRALRAWHWLSEYAPEDFRYHLQEKKPEGLTSQEEQILSALRNLVSTVDLETIGEQDLGNLIWEKVIKALNGDAKQTFTTIYRSLIGRDQGPRLPNFLKEIGKERLMELL